MSDIYLSRIKIENFRTFGDFDISIPAAPGLTLLTGTNGLGKSSFFDAIEWGLTGTVRRFDRYLKKSIAEERYLTRRTAPANSHKILLGYGDGHDVERSAESGPSSAAVVELLKQGGWGQIRDVGTYLAFTHFLGQAAQQRFTSRESPEQWEALKGPSGIERLEEVRQGLRGRATQLAFTRRIEQEKAVVEDLKRQIAQWQGWRTRLERLQNAMSATGALSPQELATRIADLGTEVSVIAAGAVPIPEGSGNSERLTIMDKHIAGVRRVVAERRATLDSLAGLPAQYVAVAADARSDGPALISARNTVEAAKAALSSAESGATAAATAVEAQAKIVTSVEADIALHEAARQDVARRAQLNQLVNAAKQEESDLQTRIASHRAEITELERAISLERDRRSDLAQKRAIAEAARRILDECAKLAELGRSASTSAAAYAAAAESASRAKTELPPLVASKVRLAEALARAETTLEAARKRSSEIAAAVARLSTHIHEDDTTCPVCSTPFEPGELKLLAESAAAAGDTQLVASDAEVERIRSEVDLVDRQIASLEASVNRASLALRTSTVSQATVVEARAAIAVALHVDADVDLHATALARDQSARTAFLAADAAFQSVLTSAAGASVRHATLQAEADEIERRLSETSARTSALEAEERSCAERLAARGQSGATIEEISARLRDQQEQLTKARDSHRSLVATAEQSKVALAGHRAHLSVAERELAQATDARAAAERSAAAIASQWSAAGLEFPPSLAGLEAARSSVLDALGRLDELGLRQTELGRDNEASLLQREIDEIKAAMIDAGGEVGSADSSAFEETLKERLKTARAAHKLSTSAKTAVNKFTDSLKQEAIDFSAQFLAPLNHVIDAFNEAMLSTPGETIRFNAEHRVDTTKFEMMLHYRDRIDASTFDTALPPQVVLSEGQLAANGFSILCAASTAYPWSRWRALLLDDPLQHNDIIHTAAFVDVMRNMVEVQGYQLIMSSHDRAESDFIFRKFDAAGLPCSTVNLTAPASSGVQYEGPSENRAAISVRRQLNVSKANQAG
jgi:DNA repair exonuclease SbcCD ATPase subunit